MVNKNNVLYENWVNNQSEDDKVFIFDNGIMMVAFDRLLHFTLPDNMISMFTFKSKYRKQTGLIANHLNYFVKYYDPDKLYVTALFKIKTILDTRSGPLSEESFIKLLYDTIITKPILDQVNALVELNNTRSIECKVKTAKYGKESSFTDEHNAILYRMSMCTNLLIPLILHYSHRFMHTNKMFIINKYYDPLFEICGKGINLKEKLFAFILKETKDSEKRDSQIWHQRELIGDFDPISFAETRLQNIVSNIIPKLDYNENSHNIALIRSTVSRDFRNFTKEKYKLFPTEISDERDSDDSLSQQDKMEMSMLRKDLSNVVISTVNKETVLTNLQQMLKVEISDEEIKYYKKNYSPTDFQLELIKLYFAKYFNGFSEMEALSSEQFARLVILMKYKMQSQGYKYLQHMIVGKMMDRNTNKAMRSLKFVDKIEQSDRYKRLVEKKYAKLLKLKGPRVILDVLSTLLKTKFEFIDYHNQDLQGKVIAIDEDLVSDEFLMFMGNI